MQWEKETKLPQQTTINELCCNLSDNQQILLQKLRESEDGWHINQLVIEMQLPYNTIASELMMLEIAEMVRSLPGGIWRAV